MGQSAVIPKYSKRPKTPAVLYPEGIGGREVCSDTPRGKAEYLLRTFIMAKRQKGLCALCSKPMGEDATFDHQRGRGMQGGFRDDREVIDGKWHNAAVHFLCNGLKGSRKYHWLHGKYVEAR